MKHILLVLLMSFISMQQIFATETDQQSKLTERTNNIKAQVIELNRDLFLLEEDLLHPASTRVAVYVSMNTGKFFNLESVKLKLDGILVESFLYTDKDILALKKGAIQPLYQGNIASGKHQLVAFFTGKGPHERSHKRAVKINFDKSDTEKAFEVQILDDQSTQQSKFNIKPWK